MSLKQEATEEEVEFKWGKKKAVGVNGSLFYESFTYDGVEYFLYDCVYVYRASEPKPDIGKVIKIFETPNHVKKVKLVWFFRPQEVYKHLGDDEPLENELFLASGEGIGLANINPLLSIAGKCNVVCTSKDGRNLRTSQAQLRTSDFIYYRTFDVGSCALSDSFPDKIADVKVECFFNRIKDHWLISSPEKKSYMKERVKEPSLVSQLVLDKPAATEGRDRKLSNTENSEVRPFKKRTFPDTSHNLFTGLQSNISPTKLGGGNDAKIVGSTRICPMGKRLKFSDPLPRATSHVAKAVKSRVLPSPNEGFSKDVNLLKKIGKIPDRASSQMAKYESVKRGTDVIEVTRRPMLDSSRWFKQLPWEERMRKAHEQGTLVLLENLDSTYLQSEVEDIVWHALSQRVDARIIESTAFSSPHHGRALVIFRSKEEADSAIAELDKGCLMLPNRRPLTARREALLEPEKGKEFIGHLVINKLRYQSQREEMRTAVSTSHCSQPNTAEYHMALEWKMLYEKSNIWWKELHEIQAAEIKKLRMQLNNRRNE